MRKYSSAYLEAIEILKNYDYYFSIVRNDKNNPEGYKCKNSEIDKKIFCGFSLTTPSALEANNHNKDIFTTLN